MSYQIDMPFAIGDLDKVFEVSDFLDNTDELITQFKPEVTKFLVKKSFFTGPFRHAYNKAFDEVVVRLVKKEIVSHFPHYTPEDVLTLCETDFLKLIGGRLFDPSEYETKE